MAAVHPAIDFVDRETGTPPAVPLSPRRPSAVHILPVPREGIGTRPLRHSARDDHQSATVKSIVLTTVLELFPDAWTHLNDQIRRDGQIAIIEQSVEITSENETVLDVIA